VRRHGHASLLAIGSIAVTLLQPNAPTAAAPIPDGTLGNLPDFNGDGYADLAIGISHEPTGGMRSSGAVAILYGSGRGVTAAGNQLWSQDRPGIHERAEGGDQFGWSLAPGDFDGDGFSDLAISAPFESRGAASSGAVHVLRGSDRGLVAAEDQLWTQGSAGIPDMPEDRDRFGWALAAADFDRDGDDDLVIGVHLEDLVLADGSRQANAGGFLVLQGSPAGLTSAGRRFWTQQSAGVPDRSEANDRFGASFAAGDFDGDRFPDLAVGAPYEGLRVPRAGIVHIFYGSRHGLSTAGTQIWSQATPGVYEQPELRDQFGQSLAAGDFDENGRDDLAVGVWYEDHCRICNEGIVQVLYGTRRGLGPDRDQVWHQDRPGIADRGEVGDQFGQTLATADFDGDGRDDLAIGTPWEDFTSYVHEDQGAVHVLYGGPAGLRSSGSQFWSQRTPGVLDAPERDDHFGEALGAADLDGDGYAELAVGVPWEGDTGAVAVIRGSPRGLTATGDQLWTQNSPGVLGAAKPGDRFGWSVSTALPRSDSPKSCRGSRLRLPCGR
jgi:hypothetical protein